MQASDVMMTQTADRLEERLRQMIPESRGQTAEAIRFLLAHRDEIPFQSMRELAKRAMVQPVTLVRLAQSLGLNGFQEFRNAFVEQLQDSRGRNHGLAEALVSLGRTEGTLGFAMRFAEREFEVQRRAIETLDEERLSEAATTLARADHVYVIGRRPFYAVAHALYYSLRKVKPKTELCDTGGGAGLELGEMTTNDVLVAFTTYPYSRVTLRVAEHAHACGARIIAVTDSEKAPVAQLASSMFLTSVRSFAFPDSMAGAHLIANILTALTVSELGEEGLCLIEANERQIRESGEYVIASPDASRRPASKKENRQG